VPVCRPPSSELPSVARAPKLDQLLHAAVDPLHSPGCPGLESRAFSEPVSAGSWKPPVVEAQHTTPNNKEDEKRVNLTQNLWAEEYFFAYAQKTHSAGEFSVFRSLYVY